LKSAGPAGVLGAIALTGLAPFLWPVHRFPLAALDSELVCAACLGFALLSSGLLARGQTVLGWPLPATLLMLVLVAFAQRGLGLLAYGEQATRFALFAACMLAAYLLGRRILAAGLGQPAIDALSIALVAGGLASVAIQWLQLLDLEILPSWMAVVSDDAQLRARPFANLAQANHAATYLALALFSVLYLQARFRRAALAAACLLAIASGLAMTGSRMGMAFAALGIVALFAPTALRPAQVLERSSAAAAVLAGYAVGLVAVRLVAGELDTVARFTQDTLPIRFELWRQAWQISLQHPLLGIGVGQFAAGQYWVARAGPYTYPATHCHNLVLQLASEFGWPAAIASSAAAIWWASRQLRARLATPGTALTWVLLAVLAIHSLLEYPLWHLYFAIPASLLFALGEPELRGAWVVDLRRILPAAGLAMLVMVGAFHLEYDAVAAAGGPYWLEALHIRHRTQDDAMAVLAVDNSPLFQPEVDRLLVDLKRPPGDPANGPVDRSARLLRLLPAPEVISQYVVQLARAGRIDEAIAHAARLRVFAGARYDDYRDWILDQTRDLGPQTAPLRHALRESR
jgi:O-antigen ligase